jgi:hypothetical protein
MTLMISWLAAVGVGVVQFFAGLLFAEGVDWK